MPERVNARVQEKSQISGISVVNFDTHDRGGLPGDEGHEGRDLGEFDERTGSRHSPVQTEILDGRNKRSNSSLTARSHKVNNALSPYPKSRRSSRPRRHYPDAQPWFLQRSFRRSAQVSGQSNPSVLVA